MNTFRLARSLPVLALVLVSTALAITAAPADADQVYHSERLEFAPLIPGDEGQGQVVNIHANGPVVGALERYQVRGAAPSTDYAVIIQDCEAEPVPADFITTATLSTDARGNGHAKAQFSAEALVPFSGATIEIRWVLRAGGEEGVDAYVTPCTTVVID